MKKIANNAIDLIGKTPLLQLSHYIDKKELQNASKELEGSLYKTGAFLIRLMKAF